MTKSDRQAQIDRRARELFDESVDRLDAGTLSRLNQGATRRSMSCSGQRRKFRRAWDGRKALEQCVPKLGKGRGPDGLGGVGRWCHAR